jgi:polysaccharide chain length determinant protein (PEP-CTERM system associated)
LIPGKKYKPEDFLEIAWRRRWVVIGPFAVIALGTLLWSLSLPNRYRSQALVLVIPPQVPENYVRPPVTETLKERLESMRQQIMSRTQLERIITEFDLYEEERKTMFMDQVVQLMQQRDIRIDVPRTTRRDDPGSFKVGYESDKPKTAMLVTERLASLFVRANLEGRSIQADATTQFLQSQVDETLRKLQDTEARLESFRRENAGRLPSDVQTNLQFMQTTSQEIQRLSDAIKQDRERQLVIERTIADETAFPIAPAPSGGDGSAGPNAPPQSAAQQLAAARSVLASLKMRLTSDHPDVRILERRIAELERKANQEALQQPVTDGIPSGALAGPELMRQRRLASLRAEHDGLERTISANRVEVEKLRAGTNQYKSRLQFAPALEAQLTQLMRDYDTIHLTYTDLLKKLQDAKVAANMEQRQIGEQFRLVDAPQVPDVPSSPNRFRLNLMGLLAGLGVGLALAALLEYRDTSLRTEDDVLVALSLPVLALVPTMRTVTDRTRRKRRRLLMVSSAATVLIVAVAAVVWKLKLLN